VATHGCEGCNIRIIDLLNFIENLDQNPKSFSKGWAYDQRHTNNLPHVGDQNLAALRYEVERTWVPCSSLGKTLSRDHCLSGFWGRSSGCTTHSTLPSCNSRINILTSLRDSRDDPLFPLRCFAGKGKHCAVVLRYSDHDVMTGANSTSQYK